MRREGREREGRQGRKGGMEGDIGGLISLISIKTNIYKDFNWPFMKEEANMKCSCLFSWYIRIRC